MIKNCYLLLILISLASCKNKQQVESGDNTGNTIVDTASVINDTKNNLNIQTASISEIDSSGILMFPLSMGESESDRASSYKSMPNGYWNIIFLNSKTNTYHLLSENKMIIRSYNQKYGSDNTERISQTKNYIFYSITSDDFDKDKKLTENDPTYLFISDKEGKKFKQLSPDNYDVVNWQYLKSVNKIVMACKKDSDKNNKFDDEDEIAIFEIDTTSEMGPKEVFSAEFKNHLKILFDRDWKRIKK